MTLITEDKLREIFTYHAPEGDQPERYERIRQAGLELALTIHRDCPISADASTAIRKIREAVMTANAAIALKGLV